MANLNASKDILDDHLREPLRTPASRLEFATSLWNPRNRDRLTLENFQQPNFEAYFGYYHDLSNYELNRQRNNRINECNCRRIAVMCVYCTMRTDNDAK